VLATKQALKSDVWLVVSFLGAQGKKALHISANEQDCINETLHSTPNFLLLVKNPAELNFSLVMVG